MSMQSEEPVNTIMFVSGRKPEAIIEQDLQRRGLKVEWANSIKAAKDLLASAVSSTRSSRPPLTACAFDVSICRRLVRVRKRFKE